MQTIHVTNASSRNLHHGDVFNIMAKPRHWERFCGNVPILTPSKESLDKLRAGELTVEEYKLLLVLKWESFRGLLYPGRLSSPFGVVKDGDTLVCACSKKAAANGNCHRVWAAAELARVGWNVILDGIDANVSTV